MRCDGRGCLRYSQGRRQAGANRAKTRRITKYDTDLWSLFFFDGKETIQITHDGGPGVYSHQSAELNDLGQITWTRHDFGPGPDIRDTMFYSDGVIHRLTDETTTATNPDLNNHSQVIWLEPGDGDGGRVIKMWDGGIIRTVVDNAQLPNINDRGDIAFSRSDGFAFNAFLLRDGELYQLTDDRFVADYVHSINRDGEVAWQRGIVGSNIMYLRRFELGDLNCDGMIDHDDVAAFLLALFDRVAYDNAHPHCDPMLADIDGNAIVDALDIEPFIDLLFP